MKFKLKTEALVPKLEITKGAAMWLMFSMLLTMSWHIPNVPVWTFLAVPALMAWRYWLTVNKKPLPPRYLLVILTGIAFLAVLGTYRSFLGRDPGITAVILLSTLKLLELKNQRDYMFIVFLCYFLVMGYFLYDQNIPDLLFMILAVIIITAALVRLNHDGREKVKIRYLLKTSIWYFVLSVPFMVVLFFLFPRTSGPIWNLPQDSDVAARSGFNDSVAPGQFAELAASNVTAFRVKFPHKNMPPQQDLYFRGLVMWFTDGTGWYQGVIPTQRFQEPGMPEGDRGIRHVITLEPHNQRWSFALDLPIEIPTFRRMYPGNIIMSYNPITRPVEYTVVSTLNATYDDELHPRYRSWALQLPEYGNPRLRELGRAWRDQSSNDAAIVDTGLRYIRENGFTYTLRPGKLAEVSPFDDFFFNKKSGFCEHYSAAFAILMRSAGVPARLVLGYQGGEYNAVGNYLIVRQYDAHAWVEVWLEGRGWTRVDPTAQVVPARIVYGSGVSRQLTAGMSEEEQAEALRNAMNKSFLQEIARRLQDYWDTVSLQWNVWIMTYDRYRQHNFLKSMGIPAGNRWNLLAILVIVVTIIFFLVSWTIKRLSIKKDPIGAAYEKFCKKTGGKGFRPLDWEGPLDFCDRVCDGLPHRTEEIKRITDLYVQLRFGPPPTSPNRLRQLKQAVAQLRI